MKMLTLTLFSAATGLALLGAAPPPGMDGMPGAGPAGYPPCSHALRDRCIQLHERGVADPANLALNDRLAAGRHGRRWARGPMPGDEGMGPRYAGMRGGRVAVLARNDYPPNDSMPNDYRPCAGQGDDRCIQAPPAAAAAPRMVRVYRAHYDRALVRTGERG
jgi:hypothetical protein